jgi:hypothetical protein
MKLDYHIFKGIVNGYLALHFDKPRRPTFFNVTKVYLELNAVTKTHPAVLIVDILRLLPFTGSIVNRFATNVIGRYFYGCALARKAEAFAKCAPPAKLAIA